MQKKGASHADWAISLGIFLVYVLGLFIMIQPGVTPVFRNDNLMNIVRTSFMDNQVIMTKTPIYISDVVPLGDGCTSYKYDIELDLKEGDYELIDSDRESIDFEETKKGIRFEDTSKENAIFYLLYSDADIFKEGHVTILRREDLFDGRLVLSSKTCDVTFEYSIGSEVSTKGFSKSVLASLSCANKDSYENLKDKWNFPPNKDFMFMIYDGAGYMYGEPTYECSVADVYEQADVFVDEFVIYVFENDGTLKPMRVNMRVW